MLRLMVQRFSEAVFYERARPSVPRSCQPLPVGEQPRLNFLWVNFRIPSHWPPCPTSERKIKDYQEGAVNSVLFQADMTSASSSVWADFGYVVLMNVPGMDLLMLDGSRERDGIGDNKYLYPLSPLSQMLFIDKNLCYLHGRQCGFSFHLFKFRPVSFILGHGLSH